jgi:two-component system sensor histidine kinase KdpD
MHAETVALSDVVGVAVKDVAKALRDRKTEVNLSADFCKLWLDKAVLRRVLVILIEHAARQTPPGSTVSIQAGRDSTAVRLQVVDEGDGIPPADLDKMFTGYQLPCADDQSRSGAGMHLTVCRGYIEAMGGTITAANRTDRRGTVFTLTFPVAV